MTLATHITSAAENLPLPDSLLRLGISRMVGRSNSRLASAQAATSGFAADMESYRIAEHTEAANRQHYELPPGFFGLVLGPRRKYSCCLYPTGRESLEEAELHALEETIAHAGLADGQEILELGCGWGSLSLFMARRFPNARIMAVSNAVAQRGFIEAQAQRLGLQNLQVITADMNEFDPARQFDRVVSVEMFEHMANWRGLLTKLRGWLRPGGKLFVHVFAHATQPYRFDHEDEADWIARYFFTGGIMPSHDLIAAFPDLFTLTRDWRWSGTHYQRTAQDWLRNYDREASAIRTMMEDVYGAGAKLWFRRWRLFFLATAGLFGHAGGEAWGVSHYLLTPVP
ncbi:MAG TPA: cyclopropane-fatty-acyl-phospholipid synthase family protein [Acidocella sp.]|nr:cyclopropane-fatty-acyl-phospholipid synthase family protein [Acidocella sp.]